MNTVTITECKKHFLDQTCTNQSVFSQNTSGHVVLKRMQKSVLMGLNVFHCRDGSVILISSRCDGLFSCPNDHSDETNCNSLVLTDKDDNSSREHPQRNSFFAWVKLHFISQNEKATELKRSQRQNALNGTCYLENDLVVDWDFDWINQSNWELSEESELIQYLQGKRFLCKKPNQLPCVHGHSKCYDISHICLFSLNTCDLLVPCRNGGHMQNCKEFHCNAYFKCKWSYCLPWSLVCNGQWDCPEGNDETFHHVCSNNNNICRKMFSCLKARICIHLACVCDGVDDCPFGDDEEFCWLKAARCPLQCECLAFALTCQEDHQEMVTYPFQAIKIDKAPLVFQILPKFVTVYFLSLQHCKISEKYQLKFYEFLIILSLQHNMFSQIPTKYFGFNLKLQYLSFSHNKISSLDRNAFYKLSHLVCIVLSDNPISRLPQAFSEGMHLNIVLLANVTFFSVDENVFEDIKAKFVLASDYKICCVAPQNSVCITKMPWFKSCADLLETKAFSISLITTISLALVVNILVAIVHLCFMDASNKPYTAITVAVSGCNLLFAFYSGILWITHLVLLEKFAVRYEWWVSSTWCFISFCLFLLFDLGTQGFTLWLSFSRLMMVFQPIDCNFKRTSYVLKIISWTTFVSCILSLFYTLLIYIMYGNIGTKLCMPWFNPERYLIPLILIIFLIGSQFLTACGIPLCSVATVLKTKKIQNAAQKTKNRSDDHINFTVQFVLLSVSAVSCWIPCNLLSIAFSLTQYPPRLMLWFLVTVFPSYYLSYPLVLLVFVIKNRNKRGNKQRK